MLHLTLAPPAPEPRGRAWSNRLPAVGPARHEAAPRYVPQQRFAQRDVIYPPGFGPPLSWPSARPS